MSDDSPDRNPLPDEAAPAARSDLHAPKAPPAGSAPASGPPRARLQRGGALLLLALLVALGGSCGWWALRRAREADTRAATASPPVPPQDASGDPATDGGPPPNGPAEAGSAAVDSWAREVLRGRAELAGQPVVGAVITVSGGADPVLTEQAGEFSVRGLRPGRYAVRAVGVGGAAFLDAVPVPDPEGKPLLIVLRAAPALGGRVVDGEGRALAGAEVTLGEGLVAPLPRTERSSIDGIFRFEAVRPGRYLVTAAATGYVTVALPLKMATSAPPDLQLVLARAALLSGTVVDEEDHPVAGARVALARDGISLARAAGGRATGATPLLEPAGELGVVRSPIPYPPLDGPLEDVGGGAGAGAGTIDAPSAVAAAHATVSRHLGTPSSLSITTDGQGRFHAGGMAAGQVTAVASHPAFLDGRSAEVALVAGAEATVRVVLRRALVVRGRVRDGAGAPVVGAELWIDGALATISDRKGRWELRRLPGPFEVEVRARGRSRSPQHVDPAFRPGLGGEIDLTVGGADSRLSGVVLDVRSLPVAGARVSIEGPDGSKQLSATDGNGEFVVDSAPPGPISLHVAHGDHLRASLAGVQPGDDVRITLAAGGAVEGDVVDRRGGVAPGSKVTIEDAGGDRHQGVVDRTGRFRVSGCAPGPASLRGEAPGYLPAVAAIDLPAADRPGEVVLRDVRVTLAEAGLLTGTVSDRWGQAVAGATIEAAGSSARSDGAGRFSLSPLPTGPLQLLVTTPQGIQVSERAYIERGRAASIDVRIR